MNDGGTNFENDKINYRQRHQWPVDSWFERHTYPYEARERVVV